MEQMEAMIARIEAMGISASGYLALLAQRDLANGEVLPDWWTGPAAPSQLDALDLLEEQQATVSRPQTTRARLLDREAS